jgi:hypothetical protein
MSFEKGCEKMKKKVDDFEEELELDWDNFTLAQLMDQAGLEGTPNDYELLGFEATISDLKKKFGWGVVTPSLLKKNYRV